MQKRLLTTALVGLFGVVVPAAWADEQVDYLSQIKPIFTSRCVACHGALKQEAGLRLDTAAAAIRGGESGAAILAAKPASSELLGRIRSTDASERMPAEGDPLTPQQIALIESWIEQGALAPPDEQPERDPRDHWAFRPLVVPQVPGVSKVDWVRNPIDAFVADYQQSHDLTPQVEASRDELVRRLYLDLIGLPPTDEERAQLDADTVDQWYERLADRLLDDPRHGQRWARHWMDIWRYSDWWGLGDQLRNSQPHIWHFRDWIVESLNADTPYDEMVRLMLAADELAPNDLSKLRATGFLARNYFLFNRNQWMDETVEHVSKALLGLTMNCAKCHDHKYDPIEQTDYYRMRAIFEPYYARVDLAPHESDLARDGIPCVFDGQLDAPTYRFVRGQESQPDKSAVIAPGVPRFLDFARYEAAAVQLPTAAWQPQRRSWVAEAYLEAARKNLAAAEAALSTANAATSSSHASAAVAKNASEVSLEQLDHDVAAAELRGWECRVAAERAAWTKADDSNGNQRLADNEREKTVAAVRAERQVELAKARRKLAGAEKQLASAAADKKEAVEKELMAARDAFQAAEKKVAADVSPSDRYTPMVGSKWTPTRFYNSTADDPEVTFAPTSSGRRLALARWITHPQNPLAARVAANHLWARHFGTPLVSTVFDFGRKQGEPPQLALLDWLAAELIHGGWSMKHMHRLIVGSATYRRSSSATGQEENLAKDPPNAGWWRRTPVRLESQLVRDAILQLAGRLDATPGGPPVPAAAQAESRRRSLYFFHSNNERNLLLSTFDEATVKECYRRDESIVPQQALALTNSRLVLDSAQAIAARLTPAGAADQSKSDDTAFARRAFREVLGVEASDRELASCLRALAAWRKLPSEEGLSPQALLVWTLLNHNDFVTLR